MALAYNNTSIPPRGGIVNFNNASKEKVIFDNTTVWTMQKDLIITNGATSYYGAPRYGSGDGPSTAQTSMTSQGWRIYNDSRCVFGLPTKVTFTGFTTLKFTIVKNSVFNAGYVGYRTDQISYLEAGGVNIPTKAYTKSTGTFSIAIKDASGYIIMQGMSAGAGIGPGEIVASKVWLE